MQQVEGLQSKVWGNGKGPEYKSRFSRPVWVQPLTNQYFSLGLGVFTHREHCVRPGLTWELVWNANSHASSPAGWISTSHAKHQRPVTSEAPQILTPTQVWEPLSSLIFKPLDSNCSELWFPKAQPWTLASPLAQSHRNLGRSSGFALSLSLDLWARLQSHQHQEVTLTLRTCTSLKKIYIRSYMESMLTVTLYLSKLNKAESSSKPAYLSHDKGNNFQFCRTWHLCQ